jgi:biopolymer transport protein ExbB
VLGYNWLQRRNKLIAEDLGSFANDIHGYMSSGGALKPAAATRAASKAPSAAPAKA